MMPLARRRIMGRQLIAAFVWSALIGALAGSLMSVIAFSENLSMRVVDANGDLDLGFLAMVFLTWAAPIAAASFALILLGTLVVDGIRWAAARMPAPGAPD
jgi:hypothetical protein